MNQQTPNSLKLYLAAKASLGQTLSDGNANFGCAITVNNIAIKAWGHPIGGGASTNLMYGYLKDTTTFKPVLLADVLAGDIIIAPTGYATDPTQHGHVGVVGQFGILSNSSEDGAVHEQWNIPRWLAYYVQSLGFPLAIFRAI
jgi:hypothetical protein